MNKWLFKYLPGARGDFLSNVLGNDVRAINTFYKLPPTIHLNYIKIHALQYGLFSRGNTSWLNEFNKELNGEITYDRIFQVCKETGRRTLRILTNTDEEKIDAIYMNYAKNHISGNPAFLKFEEVNHQENFKKFYRQGKNFIWIDPSFNDDDLYLDRYDEVVNFNDLYDVDFLINFYIKHTDKEPSPRLIKAIKYNIESNPRYSQSEFYAKGVKNFRDS